MNGLDWISKWSNYLPHKIAVVELDTQKEYSYREIHQYSFAVTQLLKSRYREGDRIAVLAEQSALMIALFSACQRLGIILVPINYRLSTKEIFELLKDCEPSLIIFNEGFKEKLTLARDYFNCVSQTHLTEQVYNIDVPDDFTNISFSIKEDLPIFLFYTSGTTQKPKGVLYTNKMLFWNSLNTTMQLELTSHDRTINILPPYHTSGWNVFVTPLLHNGGTIGILKKFEASDVLRALEKTQSTVFICLPTILQMIAKDPDFQKTNLSSLRYIVTGGEFITQQSIEFWWNEKNILIRPGYGLTEAGPSITSLHQDMIFKKPNSIGKPNFYVDIDIRDSNDQPVGDYETGELCIKGPIVTTGYWNNSVATKNQLRNGWFHTRDLAYRDKDGYYFLKGRMDDMYISGGENIFPQEIEQLISQFPHVEKAIVLPVNHDVWGAVGAVFIKTTHNLKPIDIENYLKDKLAKYKFPKYYFFLSDFPATSVGKISRKELYKLFNKQNNNEQQSHLL